MSNAIGVEWHNVGGVPIQKCQITGVQKHHNLLFVTQQQFDQQWQIFAWVDKCKQQALAHKSGPGLNTIFMKMFKSAKKIVSRLSQGEGDSG